MRLRLLIAIIAVLLLVRTGYVLWLPIDALIQFVPDDTFYYLELAQNFANTGRWTFDGFEPATGFHLLFGYGLAGLISLMGEAYSWQGAVVVTSIFNLFLLFFAAVLIALALSKLSFRGAFGALLIFMAPALLLQSTLAMESTLVIFCASWLIYAFVHANTNGRLRFVLLGLVAGFIGALARSDFGLFPAMLFGAHLLVHLQAKHKLALLKNGAPLAGAVLGTLVVLAHNYMVSGEIAQASAQMKLYWSSLQGHTPIPILLLVLSLFLPLMVIPPYLIWERFSKNMPVREGEISANHKLLKRVLGLAASLTIIGYIAFYSLNSASLQVWYVSNVLVPACLLMFLLFDGFLKQRQMLAKGIMALYSVYALVSFIPPWPHQTGMLNAAHEIGQALPENARIGVWNAGIIGHVSARGVINIDGLVNDTIYDYIVEDRLLAYLRQREINYIVDYAAMLTSEGKVARSGLSLEEMARCLIAVRVLDGGAEGWRDSNITLYRFAC